MYKTASLLSILLAFLSTEISFGALTISITGSIESASSSAFSVGESVTVIYTIDDNLGAPNMLNSTTSVYWETSGVLWSDVTVSGAAGTYNSATQDSNKHLESGDRFDLFYASALEDTANGFGIFRNGEELNFIEALISPTSLVSTIFGGDSMVTPEKTFVNGVYDVSSATEGDNNLDIFTDSYTNFYSGSITTIEIQGGVVPEPSSVLLVILGSLPLIVSRNRRG